MNTELVGAWYNAKEELAAIKQKELSLRKLVFADNFPEPKEGVNKVKLDDDYALKCTYKLTRKIVEEKLPEVPEEMKDKLKDLIKYKPSIVLSAYNKLTDEERNMFDNCLEISPATPALSIEKPKRK